MFRGKTTFICDECHHLFRAPDIEYGCTAYSVPQPCPKCGSHHTLPLSFFSLMAKAEYRKIWKKEEG